MKISRVIYFEKNMISYNTKLIETNLGDLNSLKQLLEWHRLAFNEAAKIQFNEPKNSIVILHSKFYGKLRESQPQIPSQVLIRGEQECLSAYRSIKSNKHKKNKPMEKKRLSMRLDKRLYSKKDLFSINITTANKRKAFKFVLYPKLKQLLEKYPHQDPLIYESDSKLYISFCFDTKPKEQLKQKLALGVDIGIRVPAACSDGRIIIDRKFNKEKRKLRFLKRQLQSKRTKSARRHLNKLRHKEHNKNKNQTHFLANEILKTNADTIVLENLKGIKAKKCKYQNKNPISQVPLFELRRIITYKAETQGKTVLLVSPYNTSLTDSITGKVEGNRIGRRFYSKTGLVLDADLNASRNIGQRSKLPVSYGNILDGQALVTRLNNGCKTVKVCKSLANCKVLQAPEFIPG